MGPLKLPKVLPGQLLEIQAPEMHVPGTRYDPFLGDSFGLGVVVFGMVAQDYLKSIIMAVFFGNCSTCLGIFRKFVWGEVWRKLEGN